MLDRTNSSFDYAAVESASSQHHRMVRAGSLASVSSHSSDQTESNNLSQQTSPVTNDRTSKINQFIIGIEFQLYLSIFRTPF